MRWASANKIVGPRLALVCRTTFATAKRRATFAAFVLSISFGGPATADTLNVDGDNPGCDDGVGPPYCTIQAGIDAAVAVNGDDVLVADGTYNELINFNDKAITVRSSAGAGVTTIDGTGLNDSVVTCDSGEGADTVLDGFTITGGSTAGNGGGMFNYDGSSPTLTK